MFSGVSRSDGKTPETFCMAFVNKVGYKAAWRTMYNPESGIGYSDVLIETGEGRIGIAIFDI